MSQSGLSAFAYIFMESVVWGHVPCNKLSCWLGLEPDTEDIVISGADSDFQEIHSLRVGGTEEIISTEW